MKYVTKQGSTSWCIVKRINLQSSTCLCFGSESLLTNYFRMQQCTPNSSAVCCALCFKTVFFTWKRQLSLCSKENTHLCSTLAQGCWEVVQFVSQTISQLSFAQREMLTDSKTYPVTDSSSDWLRCYPSPSSLCLQCVLIPAARQKINEWKIS